jgi:hypothetical protein
MDSIKKILIEAIAIILGESAFCRIFHPDIFKDGINRIDLKVFMHWSTLIAIAIPVIILLFFIEIVFPWFKKRKFKDNKNSGIKQRKLDIKLEKEIKERIPRDTKVLVSFVSGNLEAYTFANEIYSWMSRNGYHNFLSDGPSGELVVDGKKPLVGINFNNPSENTHIIDIGLNEVSDS